MLAVHRNIYEDDGGYDGNRIRIQNLDSNYNCRRNANDAYESKIHGDIHET